MTTRPTKIPTGTKGPIQIHGKAYVALLIGRSSASLAGLFILPGVIDADFVGEIQIMACTLFPPLKIPKGQRIAQLVPLPQITEGIIPQQDLPRGNQGFGSSGLTLLTMDLRDRPKIQIAITYAGEEKVVQGLLDTGADTSIVSPQFWPKHWPLFATADTVTGVGGFTLAKKTPQVWIQVDGQGLSTVLSVVPLPPTVQCLIGRDILAQLGVVLSNKHPLG